ncbi:hypothetical protein AAZX31_09G238900 [Glycine max]|nr:hypothetical protein GYH30_026219 [Glycine max]
MGLSMKVIASILLLLLGFTVITVSGDANNYYIKSTTKACCDKCYCSKSIPPKCYCADVGITCHSACKVCLCIHPQCRCVDTTDFCYEPCNH